MSTCSKRSKSGREIHERNDSLEWTEGALALLQQKIKESPPIAMDCE